VALSSMLSTSMIFGSVTYKGWGVGTEWKPPKALRNSSGDLLTKEIP
jgi:hypothetical protein